MLELVFHISISLMVLGISLFPVQTVKFSRSNLDNISGIYGFAGIVLAGTGIYIGLPGEGLLKAYIYITFSIQLIILVLFLLIYKFVKWRGHSVLINICSILLITISFSFYIYYIVGSFIYY